MKKGNVILAAVLGLGIFVVLWVTDILPWGRWWPGSGGHGQFLTSGGSVSYHGAIEVGGVTSWYTVRTIALNPLSRVWTRGLVEARVAGHTSGIGSGVLESRWFFDIHDNTLAVGPITTDVTSGEAPQFRLAVSGNEVLLQVQSTNGSKAFSGLVDVRVVAPRAEGENAAPFAYTFK